ncbi:hypothetical protein MXB_2172 [Myxobolus squamalis]|nr:hypothetical protein MXB_2172 [Myxobolus squamalis]
MAWYRFRAINKGFLPYKITHSSDNFDILYSFAQKLIKKGFAYVCHQTFDLVKGRNTPPSPWRDRPIDESLRLFQNMKDGMFREGEVHHQFNN